MSSVYPVPAVSEPHLHQFEIKRSQFISFVGRAGNRDEAEAFIRSVREIHPQARHVCWAYIAGAPNTTVMSMSDDGEPSGTAGRPMLKVLEHSGLGEVVVAVVRYFGGIKLGTGGLQRAYSDAVSLALEDLPTEERVPQTCLTLSYDYPHESVVRHLLEQYPTQQQSCEFGSQVVLTVLVAASEQVEFERELVNKSAGGVVISYPDQDSAN
ncbi:YigZ family protein [Oceanobacter mangrovi]|uniref:YigZ family protein n=1 Tax=Oceanobacter mangrovi TaxID=2862510 RepID=UPI001C8F069D|nr:YigZ family protein [Oceanobacter mangrovi]